jgi:hypothetical protein
MNDRPTTDSKQAVDEARRAHAALRYTTLRLAIFLVALALLWLVRARGVVLVALALAISGLASYVLLGRQREAMSAQLAAASSRRRERAQARAAREDDLADSLRELDEEHEADDEKQQIGHVQQSRGAEGTP